MSSNRNPVQYEEIVTPQTEHDIWLEDEPVVAVTPARHDPNHRDYTPTGGYSYARLGEMEGDPAPLIYYTFVMGHDGTAPLLSADLLLWDPYLIADMTCQWEGESPHRMSDAPGQLAEHGGDAWAVINGLSGPPWASVCHEHAHEAGNNLGAQVWLPVRLSWDALMLASQTLVNQL